MFTARGWFGVSERRACAVTGQPRSTQRLAPPVPSDDELALRAWLRDFSTRRPRWGWRRAATEARKDGWRQQQARPPSLAIRRLACSLQTKEEATTRSRPALVGQMCPIRPNVLWAADFQFDQTRDGRNLKILNIIDELTHESLSGETDRSIDADHVVSVLDKIAGF